MLSYQKSALAIISVLILTGAFLGCKSDIAKINWEGKYEKVHRKSPLITDSVTVNRVTRVIETELSQMNMPLGGKVHEIYKDNKYYYVALLPIRQESSKSLLKKKHTYFSLMVVDKRTMNVIAICCGEYSD